MKLTAYATALIVSVHLLPGAAEALSLKEGAQPAEFPPASYTADTYVDSRGCLYIRAGYGGSVTWVPRVTRSREVVCNARPTGGATAASSAAVVNAPVTAPAPVVAPTPVATPTPGTVRRGVPQVATAPRTVVTPPAPAPAPVGQVVSGAVSGTVTHKVHLTCTAGAGDRNVRLSSGHTVPMRCATAPAGMSSYVVWSGGDLVRVTLQSPQARQVAPAPVVRTEARATTTRRTPNAVGPGERTVHITCPERTGVSRLYTNDGSVIPVRCGPQTQAPVTYYVKYPDGTVTKVVGTPAGYGYGTRRQKYPSTSDAAPVTGYDYGVVGETFAPPPGYKPAWEDDRLNPYRGPRSAYGDAQMHAIWSETRPRVLVTE